MAIERISLDKQESGSPHFLVIYSAIFHYNGSRNGLNRRRMSGSLPRVKEYLDEEMANHSGPAPSLDIDASVPPEESMELREYFSTLCRKGASA